jgi:hypothetical protein
MLLDESFMKRILTKGDVVYAIWPDKTYKCGYGAAMIMGRALVRNISSGEEPKEVAMTAILYADWEQARTIWKAHGEKDQRN